MKGVVGGSEGQRVREPESGREQTLHPPAEEEFV